MKKHLKLLVSLVVFSLSILVVKSSSVYAQEESNIIEQLYAEKSETFYQNQTESIIQYNQLLNNIKIGSQGLSDTASVAWSRNATLEKEKKLYDNSFGGAYINEEGNLVVLITENTYAKRGAIKKYTSNDDIIIETCKYSYNELNNVIDLINDNLEVLQERGAGISSMYRRVRDNCVYINVRDLTEYKEAEIRKIVDTPFMIIQNTEEINEYQDNMKGGYEIKNNSTSSTATLGFCAIKNGVRGYVTASHFCRSIGHQISYNGTVIGTVTQSGYYPNTYADASFITANSAATPTNMIMSDYYCTATSVIEHPEDTAIFMYGKVSGLRAGTIHSYNHTYVPYDSTLYTVTNHGLADYTSAEGDSGAPLFIYNGHYNNQHTCTLIGIHSATARAASPATKVFVPYANIVELLNVTALTE